MMAIDTSAEYILLAAVLGRRELLKSSGKMPKDRRFIGQSQSMDPVAVTVQFNKRFSDVRDLHIGIDPARNG